MKTVQGRMYVRVTAHVYNVGADYERLAEAVAAGVAAAAGPG